MFSVISSILTTRIGAAVGWGLLALALAAGCWFYVQNLRQEVELVSLRTQVTNLQVANESLAEVVRVTRNQAEAMGMSLDGCLAAYDEYVDAQEGIQETVAQIKVRPREEVKGVADEKSSTAVAHKYNDLLGM